MEGDAGGVGDVAEEDFREIGFSRFEDLRQECRAESLALAVDRGIVGAREVDALEGAGTR